MIIADTNVISDAIAARPTPKVQAWLGAQDVNELWTTAVTAAELRAGAAALDPGKCRDLLTAAVEAALKTDFEGRVLPFDDAASMAFAQISAPDVELVYRGTTWICSLRRSP